MDEAIARLFERYEETFRQALAGEPDMDGAASLYATDVIAASPLGVRTARNDESFRQAMVQGYAHYRETGVRRMQVRQVRISPMDDRHCVAHVAWSATYARPDLPETVIDFDVHYLVQVMDGEARVFGWVSGDEQALLRQHGIA